MAKESKRMFTYETKWKIRKVDRGLRRKTNGRENRVEREVKEINKKRFLRALQLIVDTYHLKKTEKKFEPQELFELIEFINNNQVVQWLVTEQAMNQEDVTYMGRLFDATMYPLDQEHENQASNFKRELTLGLFECNRMLSNISRTRTPQQ